MRLRWSSWTVCLPDIQTCPMVQRLLSRMRQETPLNRLRRIQSRLILFVYIRRHLVCFGASVPSGRYRRPAAFLLLFHTFCFSFGVISAAFRCPEMFFLPFTPIECVWTAFYSLNVLYIIWINKSRVFFGQFRSAAKSNKCFVYCDNHVFTLFSRICNSKFRIQKQKYIMHLCGVVFSVSAQKTAHHIKKYMMRYSKLCIWILFVFRRFDDFLSGFGKSISCAIRWKVTQDIVFRVWKRPSFPKYSVGDGQGPQLFRFTSLLHNVRHISLLSSAGSTRTHF